jgi:hypothetical protein
MSFAQELQERLGEHEPEEVKKQKITYFFR